MAKLNRFKQDQSRIEAGEWINPGEEYDGLEIKTRGYTDAYKDNVAARLRRAAAQYGGSPDKVPNATAKDIIVESLVKHLLIDVRGLEKDDGSQVTVAEFTEMLRSHDYPDLFKACTTAAAMVGLAQAQDIEDAVGN